MIIETFRLKNMLRFKDEIGVDLRALPVGLVAFVGPNGEGKTTLLETAFGALYRQLPSRSDRELLDYATDRDSFVETTFLVDGEGVYRARVNLDGPRRVSDAVLEQTLPDGSKAILSDGRVTTYDDAIAKRFPPRELVLASAFAAQNRRGSFVTLAKKERRELFAQLLGAERYEAMSVTARTAASLVEQARVRLQALGEVLARETGDAVQAELDLLANGLQIATGTAETKKATILSQVNDLEARLATMQDAVAAHGAAALRITSVKTDLATRQQERKSLADSKAVAERAHAGEIARISNKRDSDLTDITERLAGNQKIQAQAAAIRAALAAVEALDAQLRTSREELIGQQAVAADARRAVHAASKEQDVLHQAKADLARATRLASLLGDVPCRGADAFAGCQFLLDATDGRAQIAALERQVAEEPTVLGRVAELEALSLAADARMLATQEAIAHAERARRNHEPLTKYAGALEAAEARITELTDRQTHVQQDADQAVAAADRRHEELLNGLDQRAAQLETTIARLTTDLDTAETDLAALGDRHARAITLQTQLKDARGAWDTITAELATLAARQQDLQRRRADLEARRARYRDVSQRQAQLETELVEWQTLAKALGRDGLPTLEIDAAGPTVSGYCNDLMNAAFGPRFTLELITEQAKRDGKGTKEVFSINVLDNARGGEVRDIADLSGGEQVIVDEALKNALCIFMNVRSQMPLRTCWRDETTGPLDAENAPRYVQMLRRVQELAGFAQVLFVTHNAEAAALADVQLYVHDGKVDVRMPPFQEAA